MKICSHRQSINRYLFLNLKSNTDFIHPLYFQKLIPIRDIAEKGTIIDVLEPRCPFTDNGKIRKTKEQKKKNRNGKVNFNAVNVWKPRLFPPVVSKVA